MLTATQAWYDQNTEEVCVTTSDGRTWEMISLIDNQLTELGFTDPDKWFVSHPTTDALWNIYDQLMEN